IHASNSVISWPAILAHHPHLPYAYVAETRGTLDEEPPAPMKDVFTDFPVGTQLGVVDYTEPTAPVIVQNFRAGINLQSVSVNSTGNLLVTGSTEKGKELAVAPLINGLIDTIYYFTDSLITDRRPRDDGLRNLVFHPRRNIIAANLNGESVTFYRVHDGEGELRVERIGAPVAVGKKLSVGHWHPTGNFFLVTDVNWGDGSLGAVLNGKGSMVSVRFAADGRHRIAGQVKTGKSPEGFDLSPDGRYAVAVNMERTYLPKNFWFIPGRKTASLSLIEIDPDTGTLRTLGKRYGFAGALPEDAAFDAESNTLAVAVYHARDAVAPRRGWIEFWELTDEALQKTETRVEVTRGVHNLLLVPPKQHP
ncbi:MAG: hypothetical protein AAFN92_20405, partial [Bacteroidota bacterium]